MSGDIASWIGPALAGIASGILGSLGLGGGSVLILYLTIFLHMEQAQAQGINLVFFVPCAIVAVILHSKSHMIEWKAWLPAAALGVGGAVFGSWLAGVIEPNLLRKLFGGVLVVCGLQEVFHKNKDKAKKQEEPHFSKKTE